MELRITFGLTLSGEPADTPKKIFGSDTPRCQAFGEGSEEGDIGTGI